MAFPIVQERDVHFLNTELPTLNPASTFSTPGDNQYVHFRAAVNETFGVVHTRFSLSMSRNQQSNVGVLMQQPATADSHTLYVVNAEATSGRPDVLPSVYVGVLSTDAPVQNPAGLLVNAPRLVTAGTAGSTFCSLSSHDLVGLPLHGAWNTRPLCFFIGFQQDNEGTGTTSSYVEANLSVQRLVGAAPPMIDRRLL